MNLIRASYVRLTSQGARNSRVSLSRMAFVIIRYSISLYACKIIYGVLISKYSVQTVIVNGQRMANRSSIVFKSTNFSNVLFLNV